MICRRCTSNPAMIAPDNRGEITPAAFWATDDIPSFTVGTSCSIGQPRGSYPRAPTTPSDTEDRPPSRQASRPNHGPFMPSSSPRGVLVRVLPLSLAAKPKRQSDRRRHQARGDLLLRKGNASKRRQIVVAAGELVQLCGWTHRPVRLRTAVAARRRLGSGGCAAGVFCAGLAAGFEGWWLAALARLTLACVDRRQA